MDAFAWYNLIFYIPLAIGMLFIVGIAVGGADVGHGVDLDGDGIPDVHVHVGHDSDNEQNFFLSLLGFGKVPLLVLLMTMFLTFGGTGAMANMFMEPLLRVSGMFALLSVGAACFVMFVSTGFIARTVSRLMPSTETASFKKADLVGGTGTLLFEADKDSGAVQVVKNGDCYQVQCRSSETLPTGTKVLLIDYDGTDDFFTVERDPTT